jgi:hypothetical protein
MKYKFLLPLLWALLCVPTYLQAPAGVYLDAESRPQGWGSWEVYSYAHVEALCEACIVFPDTHPPVLGSERFGTLQDIFVVFNPK